MTAWEQADVTVIGAGPSGLVQALWLARQGIEVALVEKKSGPLTCGHADGLEPRSLEILQSLGVADRIWKMANKTAEFCTWDYTSTGLKRTSRKRNFNKELSKYQEATLHQGYIENELVLALSELPNVTMYWESTPVSLVIEDENSGSDFPVRLTIARQPTDGTPSTVRLQSRYLVGCDGAHSWTRKQLGLKMIGNSTGEKWGVLDVVPLTDFPDVRCRCLVRSAAGIMMLIPRERGLVRFYVQLRSSATQNGVVQSHAVQDLATPAESQQNSDSSNGAVTNGTTPNEDRANATPQKVAAGHDTDLSVRGIEKQINAVFSQYPLKFNECEWFTVYQIGQRVAERFSDPNHRVFLAGDAIHTHSPKAGQGMNVSMQDSWNLGWKLAAVIKGQAPPSLLETYEAERRPIAERLVNFDRKMLSHFYDFGNEGSDRTKSQEALLATIDEEHSTASGTCVTYQSPAGSPNGFGGAALSMPPTNIVLGSRMPDFEMVNHRDASLCRMHDYLPASGSWRLVVFPGDLSQSSQLERFNDFGNFLSSDKGLPAQWTCGIVADYEAIVIHAAPRNDLELDCFPDVFRDKTSQAGWRYRRVFVDEFEYYDKKDGQIYDTLKIDRVAGCVLVLRPDQHVSYIGTLKQASYA